MASNGKKYAYAVLDGNEAADQFRFASSCHHSRAAADNAARRLNAKNPNYHYYVVAWDASRWAQERPSP